MSENEQTVAVRPETTGMMSVKQVADRVNAVHQILEKVMLKGTHYGTVPGCGNKMVLLKPGADVLAMTFRLVPQFKVERTDLPDGHREFDVTCSMFNPSGELLGQGVGSASTMEKKYRYRGGQENPDIADVYNTVLKIAKKRAHIDATLTVTGAADLFTQDLIDDDEPQRPSVKMPVETQPSHAPNSLSPETTGGAKISEPQQKRLFAIAAKANVSGEDMHDYLKTFGIEHSKDIPRALYDRVCAWVERGGQDEPGDAKE
jgi:uncharacterized protein with GYD domain